MDSKKIVLVAWGRLKIILMVCVTIVTVYDGIKNCIIDD